MKVQVVIAAGIIFADGTFHGVQTTNRSATAAAEWHRSPPARPPASFLLDRATAAQLTLAERTHKTYRVTVTSKHVLRALVRAFNRPLHPKSLPNAHFCDIMGVVPALFVAFYRHHRRLAFAEEECHAFRVEQSASSRVYAFADWRLQVLRAARRVFFTACPHNSCQRLP